MRRLRWTVWLVVALLAWGCAGERTRSAPKLAIVGYILGPKNEQLEHIFQMITDSGIDAALDGSQVYDVWVPASQRAEALELFTKDAVAYGYRFEPK